MGAALERSRLFAVYAAGPRLRLLDVLRTAVSELGSVAWEHLDDEERDVLPVIARPAARPGPDPV